MKSSQSIAHPPLFLSPMKSLDFNEFAPGGDYDTWKKLVLKELGEKTYEQIVWNNENGFDLEPYQVAVDEVYDVKRPESWELCQELGDEDLKTLNKRALDSLMGGSNALAISTHIKSENDFAAAMAGIHLQYISVHFRAVSAPLDLLHWLVNHCKKNGIESKSLRGSMSCNALNLSVDELKAITTFWKENFSVFRIFTVDAQKIHSGGGNATLELSYAAASSHEVLNRLCDAGCNVDDASAMIQFDFSIGNSYFPEIAKFRALRVMWRTIVEAYKPEHNCSTNCFIYASTSTFLQTTKDIHNNLLRAVTQSMSGILGGANCVQVVPYDAVTGSSSDASLRLARNIQQLLIEESHLDKAGDVASGSFYVEHLTNQMVDKAWGMFREVEALGGINAAGNYFNEKMEQSLAQKQDDLSKGRRIVVGVNKYQNKSESATANSSANTLTGFLEKS